MLKPGERLVAGLSGGIDSVVLLDILRRLRPRLRIRLAALHVNHQLSPNAARWSAFCARLCRARGIPYRSVKVKPVRGAGPEAGARAARYAVFTRQRCDYVVLAQHQDDQVETLLLQLLRGAGAKGLAAMPVMRHPSSQPAALHRVGRSPARTRAGASFETPDSLPHPSILRPMLEVTRAEILAYARERKLEWVEDESNADTHFARNFLRREVLPLLERRFPAYRATIARAAQHLGEAAGVLGELAAADGASGLDGGTLAVDALRRLSPARARNLLRHFLAHRGVAMPGARRLTEALRQALHAQSDARVLIDLGEFQLRRFEGRLHVVSRLVLPRGYVKRWRGERRLPLPELGGVLVMTHGRGQGLSLARLGKGPVTIRLRRGGERLQPDCGRPRRTLKNLLQEARVPPWERERLPLIFCGADLAWAPAIGVACTYQAAPGERALQPQWCPRDGA